jgi:hypothetical protein
MKTPKEENAEKRRPRPGEEGLGVVQQAMPLPKDSFKDGVDAHRNARRMDPAYGDAYGLGEYIEPQASSDVADLHGHAVPVAFPLYFRQFFARQTAERLAEMDEMIDERLDREASDRHRAIIKRSRKRWRNAAGGAFLTLLFFGKWIIEQLSWIQEQMPVLRTLFGFIFGAK